MALQTSGAISINDIVGEFGGTAPHALSEYYGVDTGVPASGTISISDFYGTSATVTTVTMNGVSGVTLSGYYAQYGYRIANATQASQAAVGSLTNSSSTPGGIQIVQVERFSNPGFQGIYIYGTGSGNSGWTTCVWTRGSLGGTLTRTNCLYSAYSVTGASATQRWAVGSSFGGAGSSWSGDAPVNLTNNSGQSFTMLFT